MRLGYALLDSHIEDTASPVTNIVEGEVGPSVAISAGWNYGVDGGTLVCNSTVCTIETCAYE